MTLHSKVIPMTISRWTIGAWYNRISGGKVLLVGSETYTARGEPTRYLVFLNDAGPYMIPVYFANNYTLAEIPYNPSQQGDLEDDI